MITKNIMSALRYILMSYKKLAGQGVKAYTGAVFESGSVTAGLQIGACMDNVYKTALGPTSSSFQCVCFGTGTTAPTEDDYNLSGVMVTNFTETHVQTTTYNDDGSVTKTTTYTITSTASEDIVIGEVGMFVSWLGTLEGSTVTNKTHPVMMDRTVFPTPITIPPGGVGQVVYSLTFDPSAVV